MYYIFILMMLGFGYYTVTYGIYQIKNEKNRLGGIATVILAVTGVIAPAVVLFMNQ